MTAKVNLELANVNRLSKSQGKNLACLPSGVNLIVYPKVARYSAKPTPSDCQNSSPIFNLELLIGSKFNISTLSHRGAAWK